jgi:ribosome biogenesis protein BRX1
MHKCNYVFFLEARKNGQDLYLWLTRAPNGPTIKFSVSNVHTMKELGFGGNCLKGGRGILVFDKSFADAEFGGSQTHKGMIRELLRGVFCVPQKGVRGMKPFVDRVTGVFGLDNKIWIRVYEIREQDKGKNDLGEGDAPGLSLVEIGPRFVLTPIVILEGSFGGPVIYENREFVSGSQVRRNLRLKKASRWSERTYERRERAVKKESLGLVQQKVRHKDALDHRALFA